MPIWLIQILVGIVLSVASQIISSIGKQDQQSAQKIAGVRGTIQTGGDNAPTFIIGRYGTAGKLKYAGTWGNSGETPNAYYTKEVEVSFLPIRGFSGFFVNGERVTLDASPTGDLGYAVLEYRVGGVDHLWIKTYTGAQTVADPLMRAKFGSDPDRPYTADMVGYGLGKFIATALVNRELFPGLPEFLAEVDGLELDDPRGDGAHDNPIVAAYTILKGIYYDGQWVYGPQTYSDVNFRASNLESEADKCDVDIALAGGGTMKRFRMGLEVALDAEPHAIVGELLKSCQGRWADLGGVYKFLVGEPGAPVVSFTDEDMVITEQQTFEPFPGLESLFNGITATYPEPAEAWETKEAPPRYRSDLELLDDGRRLPFSTDYKAVPYAVQVQELMRAAIEETRRFRRHTQTMPPEWWEYEVLDVAAWTSDRNGYVAKQFLITAMEDLPNANQFVGLQEIDPTDYGWESGYELPWDVVPLVIARPQPQVMTGWQAFPAVIEDAAGNPRRPSIEVQFSGGLVDVRAVRVQVRESWGDLAVIFDGELPYDITNPSPAVVLNGTFLPDTVYGVRGLYVPFSARASDWSGWLAVTTPDVKLGPLDVVYGDIDLDELGDQIEGYFDWIGGNIRDVIEKAQEQDLHGADQELANAMQFDEVRRSLSVVTGDLSASFTETITVAIVPMQGELVALADALTELSAANDGDVNSARIRFTTMTGPSGYSRVGIETRFDPLDSGDYRLAGSYWDTPNNASLPTRRVEIAEQFVIAESVAAAAFQPFIFESGNLRVVNAYVANLTAANIQAGSITADRLNVTALSAVSANLGTVTAGTISLGAGKLVLDGPNVRLLVSD